MSPDEEIFPTLQRCAVFSSSPPKFGGSALLKEYVEDKKAKAAKSGGRGVGGERVRGKQALTLSLLSLCFPFVDLGLKLEAIAFELVSGFGDNLHDIFVLHWVVSPCSYLCFEKAKCG